MAKSCSFVYVFQIANEKEKATVDWICKMRGRAEWTKIVLKTLEAKATVRSPRHQNRVRS